MCRRRMGFAGIAAFLAAVCAGIGGEPPESVLPEVVAVCGERTFRRDDVLRALRDKGRITAESGAEETALLVRREVEEQLWRTEILTMLAEGGIRPDRETALRYLERLDSMLPGEGLPGIPRAEFPARAGDSELQLKAAIDEYFRTVEPLSVDDAEVFARYECDPGRFRIPAKLGFGVIEIPRREGRERAEALRARLLQGENFFRVAAEANPDGVTTSSSEILPRIGGISQNLLPGTILPVFGNDEYWFVVRIHSAIPPRRIPFEEAAPELREELFAARSAQMLERKLRERLSAHPIRFRF